MPGTTAVIAPTQRDLHVLAIDAHGRTNWQKAAGYNKRSKVEAAMSRYKRVIGDTLKSREDARRALSRYPAVSVADHRPRGVAVFPFSTEPARSDDVCS